MNQPSIVEITTFNAVGEIIGTITCQSCDVSLYDFFVYGRFDGRWWYVDVNENTPIKRPENKTAISTTVLPADGETPVVLQAIAGTLTVGNETYEVETGEIELTFDTPGEYQIRLESFPYRPFEGVINAT